jgi:peptidyl-prolyl cis-trans isomerase SurA
MESRMKTRTALSALCLGFVLLRPASGAEIVERIVARVNDQLIKQSEFDQRIEVARAAPNAPTDLAQVRKDVLDDLIREKLLEERARELSVTATDAEVEEAVERVKRQYNLATDAEFDAALASSHMNRDDLKRQMRQTITLQKVVGRDVTGKMEISGSNTSGRKTSTTRFRRRRVSSRS